MTNLPLYELDGQTAGEVAAPEKVFACPANRQIVHSALVWFLASQRSGTHNTKTKGEVRGGGKKPWKQKGTGRARAGSNRSPLWRKGGVVFGPKPRDYGFALPKKMRKLALRVVLSEKGREGKIKIVDKLNLAEPKTKLAVKLFKDLALSGKGLIVLAEANDIVVKATRNIAGVKVVLYNQLNVFDLLNAGWLLIEKGALNSLSEVLV